MEIEQAIILTLNESRSYNKLYRKTASLREESGQKLSREAFDKSLKRLVNDRIVTRKEKGIEVQYSVALDGLGTYGKKFLLDNYEGNKLDWFEKITKVLEETPKEIMECSKKDPKLTEKLIANYQAIIVSIILASLKLNQNIVFLLASEWGMTSTKKKLEKENKRYFELIKRLSELSRKIHYPSSIHSVLKIIFEEMEEEAKDAQDYIDNIREKLFTKKKN